MVVFKLLRLNSGVHCKPPSSNEGINSPPNLERINNAITKSTATEAMTVLGNE